MVAKITWFGVRNLKTIEQAGVDLGGVTTLIGDNGVGKSAVLEALAILKLAGYPGFMANFQTLHGGFAALARDPGKDMQFGLNYEVGGQTVEYRLHIGKGHLGEGLGSKMAPVFIAARGQVTLGDQKLSIPPTETALSQLGRGALAPDRRIAALQYLLEGIDHLLPLDLAPRWAARGTGRTTLLREAAEVSAETRLTPLGDNLAMIFHRLKEGVSREEREETLDWVRLGLGDHIEDVAVQVGTHGRLELGLKLRGVQRPIPAFGLSDGELAYLALVAAVRAHQGRSILVVDAPELHFHPHLIGRVVGLLERAAQDTPVLVATHSDIFLDWLSDPAQSVRVARLDAERKMELMQLDRDTLAEWLKNYRGLGQIRADGELGGLLRPLPPSGLEVPPFPGAPGNE